MVTNSLFLKTKKQSEYGPRYKDHIFQQYKLFVNSTEKVIDRRQMANNFFLTINTALIYLIGLTFQIESLNQAAWLKSLVCGIGIIICLVYYFLIRSYRQLNTAKFRVIHEIEKELPIPLYDYEWAVLEYGKNKKAYFSFSKVEQMIPLLFALIYLLLGAFFIS